MQTTIKGEINDNLIITKRQRIASDLDYLTARLHARYSKMAVGDRAVELCRIQNMADLFQTIYPDKGITDITDFQRRCVFDLISEIYNFRMYLSGPGASLIDWVMTRFQIENLKILLRAYLTNTTFEEVDRYIFYLPGDLSLNITGLVKAESIEEFIRLTPKGIIQDSLERVLKKYNEYRRPFFFEAAMDCGYYNELISRCEGIPKKERDIINPIIHQEIDIYHLMLITRGRFVYNIPPEVLKPLHVEGTRMPKRFFTAMLADPDIASVANRLENRVVDHLPIEFGKIEGAKDNEAPILESLAWRRLCRLSNQAFRKSHMGLGAIVGYIGLRRIEVANLTAISEGIRQKLSPDTIRRHLIIHTDLEVFYV
ncbi:MAG TPA: V-type ATPase subunit [Syntrophorhabdaceae bacterium]|nr:V-type ATPase subunit [Syntrophorhabdaceae bacterium]